MTYAGWSPETPPVPAGKFKCGSTRMASSSCPQALFRTALWTRARIHAFSAPLFIGPRGPPLKTPCGLLDSLFLPQQTPGAPPRAGAATLDGHHRGAERLRCSLELAGNPSARTVALGVRRRPAGPRCRGRTALTGRLRTGRLRTGGGGNVRRHNGCGNTARCPQ